MSISTLIIICLLCGIFAAPYCFMEADDTPVEEMNAAQLYGYKHPILLRLSLIVGIPALMLSLIILGCVLLAF